MRCGWLRLLGVVTLTVAVAGCAALVPGVREATIIAGGVAQVAKIISAAKGASDTPKTSNAQNDQTQALLAELLRRERERDGQAATARPGLPAPVTPTQPRHGTDDLTAAILGSSGGPSQPTRYPPPAQPTRYPPPAQPNRPGPGTPPRGGSVIQRQPPAAESRGLPPNIVMGSDGKRHPAQGFRWASNDPNDIRALPKLGTSHPQHANVVGDKDGRWVPSEGYVWANQAKGDFRVIARPTGLHLAYNYWKDFNGDGRATVDEFVGVKKQFKRSETLELCCFYDLQCKGKTIAWKVHGPRGTAVLEDTMQSQYDFAVWPIKMGGRLMAHLASRGGLGAYKFTGYLDGKHVGSCDFEITN